MTVSHTGKDRDFAEFDLELERLRGARVAFDRDRLRASELEAERAELERPLEQTTSSERTLDQTLLRLRALERERAANLADLAAHGDLEQRYAAVLAAKQALLFERKPSHPACAAIVDAMKAGQELTDEIRALDQNLVHADDALVHIERALGSKREAYFWDGASRLLDVSSARGGIATAPCWSWRKDFARKSRCHATGSVGRR